jgi:hypothetical protein
MDNRIVNYDSQSRAGAGIVRYQYGNVDLQTAITLPTPTQTTRPYYPPNLSTSRKRPLILISTTVTPPRSTLVTRT